MAESLVFVIEEATGTNPIRVELKDHDLPFGRPRKGGAFDLGGPVNIEDIMLDGRSTPIIHTKQADNHPNVVKGHLRDHFTGDVGHARSVMDQLERIRRRMRPLKLSISRLSWTGFLRDAKFPFEGDSDIPYELTFRVLKGVGVKTSTAPTRARVTAPSDQLAAAKAILVARQAQFLALALARVARASVAVAFDNATAAVSTAQAAAAEFEDAARRADREAKTLLARCQDAKAKCDALVVAVQAFTPAQGLTKISSGTVASCLAQQTGTVNDSTATKAMLRAIQLTARERIRSASKLYQIASDDTPESIAASQLGSASRAAELGLRAADLIPGKYIRIPVA